MNKCIHLNHEKIVQTRAVVFKKNVKTIELQRILTTKNAHRSKAMLKTSKGQFQQPYLKNCVCKWLLKLTFINYCCSLRPVYVIFSELRCFGVMRFLVFLENDSTNLPHFLEFMKEYLFITTAAVSCIEN